MTSFDPGDGIPTDGAPQEMPIEESRRAASVMLRPEEIRQARAATLEAANKSLADALNIVYRLLQLLMIGMVGLFLISGFRQVNESQAGIKVQFGRVVEQNIAPGFVPSLPYPLGDVIMIETSQVSLDIDRSFWPDVGAGNFASPLQAGNTNLEVGRDGSMITADVNLAHTQWSVKYRRDDPTAYIETLKVDQNDRTNEQLLVRMAVESAAVHVVAETTIDDLLKGASAPAAAAGAAGAAANAVEQRVRELAQQTLDGLSVGIRLDSVVLKQKSAPARALQSFEAVTTAVTDAAKAIESASTFRTQRMSNTAGSAAEPLLALIDLYESQFDLGQADAAEQTLGLIREILDGVHDNQVIRVDDREFGPISLAGEAAQAMTTARTVADTRAALAELKARDFQARLAQFEAAPSVFIARQWYSAMSQLLASDRSGTFLVPQGTPPTIVLNEDPLMRSKQSDASDALRRLLDRSWARGMTIEDMDRDQSLNSDE